MRTVTTRQMQQIDRDAVTKFGIPSIVLMENAGRGAAQAILKGLKTQRAPKVVIICGPGNNGGDGFVVARHLMIAGLRPKVFVAVAKRRLRGDAAVNARILEKAKVKITYAAPSAAVLTNADVVVDALFGIGVTRTIEGPFRTLIEKINQHARKVIALDIPSGLDATTGQVHGVCVRADKTVTFHLAKKGIMTKAAKPFVGKMIVSHIGLW